MSIISPIIGTVIYGGGAGNPPTLNRYVLVSTDNFQLVSTDGFILVSSDFA